MFLPTTPATHHTYTHIHIPKPKKTYSSYPCTMDNPPGTTRQWYTLFASLFGAYLFVAFYVPDAILAMLAVFFLPVTMHGLVIGNLASNFAFGVRSISRVFTSIGRVLTFDPIYMVVAAAGGETERPEDGGNRKPCTHPDPECKRRAGCFPVPDPNIALAVCRCIVCTCRARDTDYLEQQIRDAQRYAYDTNEFAKSVYDRFNPIIDRLVENLAQAVPEEELGYLGTLQDRINNAREALLHIKWKQDVSYARLMNAHHETRY